MGKTLKNVFLYFPVCFSLESTATALHAFYLKTTSFLERWRHLQKVIRFLLTIRVTSDTPSALHYLCADALNSKHQSPLHIRNQTQPLFLEIRASLSLAVVAMENMTSYSKTKACRHAAQEVPVLAWVGWALAGQLSQLQEGHCLPKSGCETAAIGYAAILCLQLNTKGRIGDLKIL